MTPRIAPATPPWSDAIAKTLAPLTPPGTEPLALFRTLARDERLFGRFMGGGLLDKGHLTLTEREIVIDRVCALNGAEYEWGVHAAIFAKADIDGALWAALGEHFNEMARLELMLLAGFYRTVSLLVNGLRLPMEPGAVAFPAP